LILKHCINGDGSGEGESRGYILEMKSQALIQQFLFMSWRLGLNPTYRENGVIPRYTECEMVDGFEVFTEPSTGKKSRPGYGLWFSVRDSMVLNGVCGHTDERIASRQEKAYSHVFGSDEGRWLVEKIATIEDVPVGAFVYNLEVEGDNSYVAEGVVVHNCEHIQISELSKGKIVDAVIRPVLHKNDIGEENVYFVDILIATDRSHIGLVKDVESGRLNTLSMGCLCDIVTCSRCGRELRDDENCEHLENQMLKMFKDEDGIERIVAELCGRSYIDKSGKRVGDPKSMKFIEASWVRRPAFVGAVVNHFIKDVPKAASILSMPTHALEAVMDDVFRLRVADTDGMMAIRIARWEITRRRKAVSMARIAGRLTR